MLSPQQVIDLQKANGTFGIEKDLPANLTIHLLYDVWTDGSCRPNPGAGGWAAYAPDGNIDISGHADYATNNEMELTAILNALKAVPFGSSVRINSDSELAIGWIVNGWNCKANPRNKVLIDLILDLTRTHQLFVSYRWTRGKVDSNTKYVDHVAKARCKA